jgi:hypothetical protein
MSHSDTALTYTAEMFSGEQIATALNQLSDYERYTEVATLAGGEYEPATLKAFAELARTLKLNVRASYNFTIRREQPLEARRNSALHNLQRLAERGEIEPAYLYGRSDNAETEGNDQP